ncbi:hypothetical protein [uncultured Ruegeria sp.]|uniref:hypothetical protein n=1 Tax=uncultured Ruegeria sp. TaxID=259304 RepID=UPI00262707C9|nr:hypothetical protein [uncultured Ruegeria sp.]
MLNQTGTHLYNSAIGSWDDNSSIPIGMEFELAVPLVMCIAVTEARAVHYDDLKETELYKAAMKGDVHWWVSRAFARILMFRLFRIGLRSGTLF